MTRSEGIKIVLKQLGIRQDLKGYKYLEHGIALTLDGKANSITKDLYPAVAKKFDDTPSKVERAIRHTIEVAFYPGALTAEKMKCIDAVFGNTITNDIPTNSHFISAVADIFEGNDESLILKYICKLSEEDL